MKSKKFLLPLLIAIVSLTGCNGCQGNESENPPIDPPIIDPVIIHVTKVAFKENAFSLAIGETYKSEVKITPYDATNQLVTFSSDKPEIASVEADGTIKALSEGTAHITVKAADGGITDTCTVNVIDPYMKNLTVKYNSKLFTATPNKNRCHVGDEITVNISKLNGGYTFEDFTAVDAIYKEEIELTKIDNKTYKFVCPRSMQVEIVEHATAKPIKFYLNDEHNLLSETPVQSIDNGEFVEITEKGSDSGLPYYVASYGAVVRLTFSEKDLWKPTSVFIDEYETFLDDNGTIQFEATLLSFFDESDFFITFTVNAEKVIPPMEPTSLTAYSNTNFTAKYYAEDKETEIAQAYPGEKIYIKAGEKDPSKAKIDDVVYSYNIASGMMRRNSATPEEDGWYSLIVPGSYDNQLKVNISTYNANKLNKYPELVGTYMTFAIDSETKMITSFSENELVIAMDGHIDYNNKRTFTNSVSAGKITTTNNNALKFGNGWFLFAINSENQMVAPSSNNAVLAVKKENATDQISDYSISGERFVLNEKSYLSILVNKAEEQFTSAFFNFSEDKTYLGASFELLNGDSIFAEDAIYFVKDSGVSVIGIGYDSEGKCIIERPMGAYSDHEGKNGKLIVPNDYAAYYEGKRYSWSYSGSRLTLQNSSETLYFIIDTVSNEYTADGKDEGNGVPNLLNKEFNFYNTGSSECNRLMVEFLELNGTTYSGNLYYYLNSSSVMVFGFDATVDVENHTIEYLITSQSLGLLVPGPSDKEYRIHSTFEDGSITFTDDLCNGAQLTGYKLDCDKFIY